MTEKTGLQKRIDSDEQIILIDFPPPKGSNAEEVRKIAQQCAGHMHALGVNDNRNGVCMSALAAASIVKSEGVEPILHIVTRDSNRIALISTVLGAEALGIRNILCTSGTHQTLGRFGKSKNVGCIDSVQLLQALSSMAENASFVGEESIKDSVPLCLGGVAAPYADPMEMQIVRLAKKCKAGAEFLITQPVFDVDRFEEWWKMVTEKGLHEKIAIIAGIHPLIDATEATKYAAQRPSPCIPEALLERITSKAADSQRAEGIAIATETVERLSALKGLRGFEFSGDIEASLEIIGKM